MITLLENALTRKKHTLNFVDNNGKVFGYNPETKTIKYTLRDIDGRIVVDESVISLSRFLIGNKSYFGKDFSYTIASEYDDSISSINVELIRDSEYGISYGPMFLHIEGIGGEYYIEDISLTEEDKKKLFSQKNIEDALRKIEAKEQHISSMWISGKTDNNWEKMTIKEKIDNLNKRVIAIENLL